MIGTVKMKTVKIANIGGYVGERRKKKAVLRPKEKA